MLYHLVTINHIVVYDIYNLYTWYMRKKHMNYTYNYEYTLDLFGHRSKYVNIIIPKKIDECVDTKSEY